MITSGPHVGLVTIDYCQILKIINVDKEMLSNLWDKIVCRGGAGIRRMECCNTIDKLDKGNVLELRR